MRPGDSPGYAMLDTTVRIDRQGHGPGLGQFFQHRLILMAISHTFELASLTLLILLVIITDRARAVKAFPGKNDGPTPQMGLLKFKRGARIGAGRDN